MTAMTAMTAIDVIETRAIAWLLAHRDGFATPRTGAAGGWIKANGELAMAAELHRPRPWADELIAAAWRALDGGQRLAAVSARAPAFVTIYPPFSRCGLRAPALEQLLADREWLSQIPRVPLQLPIELTRRAIGLPPGWDVDELVRATSPLGARPVPGSLAPAGVYALTHTVFLVTEVGAAPERLAIANHEYLHDTLTAWLDVHHHRGDVELVAELAMVAACVGHPIPAATWELLTAAQQRDGSVVAKLGAEGTTFDAVYHSTLTAVMATALAKRRAELV
jgi:hypothetical protein